MPELPPGSRYGSFQISGKVGRGLTGPVYRAVWLKSPERTEVALKLLESRDESVRSYFLNEMNLLRRAHDQGPKPPHLVEYVTSITTNEPFALATRLYADGHDLTASIRDGMTPAQALRVVEHTAEALDYLHYVHPDAPVVHRDVKPGNILVDTAGNALLIDLSAASHQHFRLENEHGLGTPQYMPPEQYEGGEQPQTDQFALAMVAYQMLTSGKTLLNAKEDPTHRQMIALRDAGYARIYETMQTFPAAAEVITRAVAYHWQTRYPSCGEFAYDLRRALTQDGAALEGGSASHKGFQVTWGYVGMFAAGALALVLLVVLFRGGQPTAPPLTPPTLPPTITILVENKGRGIGEIIVPTPTAPGLAPTTELRENAPAQSDVAGTVRPNDQGCALRDTPSTSGGILQKITSDVALTVIRQQDGWYDVRLPDGQEGWCPGFQLSGLTGDLAPRPAAVAPTAKPRPVRPPPAPPAPPAPTSPPEYVASPEPTATMYEVSATPEPTMAPPQPTATAVDSPTPMPTMRPRSNPGSKPPPPPEPKMNPEP